MKLTKGTFVTRLEIWAPKYSSRTVLIAKYKVGTHNVIKFTKAKAYPGEWYISGSDVRDYPITQMPTKSGALQDMYEVKLSDLEPVEWQNVTYTPVDDRELFKEENK